MSVICFFNMAAISIRKGAYVLKTLPLSVLIDVLNFLN